MAGNLAGELYHYVKNIKKRKMKILNFILAIITLFYISSTVSAEDNIYEHNIYGLGLVKVENVEYLGDKIFSFELQKSKENNNQTIKLFRGNETISFILNADELDGIIVVAIDNDLREDITLTGKNFVNLLLGKMKNNESIILTCGIKPQSNSEESERRPFELTYFQISEYKNN